MNGIKKLANKPPVKSDYAGMVRKTLAKGNGIQPAIRPPLGFEDLVMKNMGRKPMLNPKRFARPAARVKGTLGSRIAKRFLGK